MRILMLADLYPPIIGGGERHVQLLSYELLARGHDVTVCTSAQQDLPLFESDKGVRILRVKGLFQNMSILFKDKSKRWPPPIVDTRIASQLAKTVQELKIEIIHTHGWLTYSALAIKAEVPIVTTLHFYGFICPKVDLLRGDSVCDAPLSFNCIACGKPSLGLAKSVATYLGVKSNKHKLRSVNKFLAVSPFVREVYLRYLGVEDTKIDLIAPFCNPVEDDIDFTGLPDDFILFVGSLLPVKGVDVLIEAYNKIGTQTKLVIIGGKHPAYSYHDTNNIRVIENAPHDVVMQAFSKCRFAVFPSIWPDPCPVVAMEAMSKSKAVIASDIGGLKYMVINNETGLLIPPGNSSKLAEAIAHLLAYPEKASHMGSKGYERFKENFVPDVIVPKIVDVYNSLIKTE